MASRLFINGRFLTQQTTGVQAFARSICDELSADTDFSLLVPEKAKLQNADYIKQIKRTGKLNGHLWEQWNLPGFVKKQPGSMLLNLCNTGPAFLPDQAVTIHDLAFLKNPAWFHPLFARYYTWLIPRLVKTSKTVFTVSETIKMELVNSFQVPETRIHVVGNKVNTELLSCLSQAPPNGNIRPRRFYLMVGSRDPRKNFSLAVKLFTEKFNDSLLVIAGGSHRSFQSPDHQEGTGILHLGYTDLSTLKWLYENAIGLINPSLYEGFGIPNLEAFALGCPVLCSDLPVFREVCGNAAFYFNPTDRDSLEECLHFVSDNRERVEEKTSLGKVIFTSFQNKNRSQILLNALAL